MASMRRSVLLGIAVLGLACSPLGPLPGGRLRGEVKPPPSDWSVADAIENVQLETRPSDPYSVNVRGAGLGDHFYLASGHGGEAKWVRHIAEDPNVRLRVADAVYELRAERVEDEASRQRFLEALKRKYDWEPTGEESERAWLFRLGPR